MSHTPCTPVVAVGAVLLCLTAWGEEAWAASESTIGLFTSVQGKVSVTHKGAPSSASVRLRDDVRFRDIIETGPNARTKAIFQDDSLLTVGEDSRVEITEHLYDPNRNSRSMIVSLFKGKMRSLVGKVFDGLGSRFEVHTPTAVAAARGTYFVTWIEEEGEGSQKSGWLYDGDGERGTVRPVALTEMDLAQFGPILPGSTGVANIGRTGTVNFTSGGRTIPVLPGQFTVANPGATPNVPRIFVPNAPGAKGATNAVVSTDVKDSPKPESPKQTVTSTGGSVPQGQGGAAAGGTQVASGGQAAGGKAGGESAKTADSGKSGDAGGKGDTGGKGETGGKGGAAAGGGDTGAKGGGDTGGGQPGGGGAAAGGDTGGKGGPAGGGGTAVVGGGDTGGGTQVASSAGPTGGGTAGGTGAAAAPTAAPTTTAPTAAPVSASVPTLAIPTVTTTVVQPITTPVVPPAAISFIPIKDPVTGLPSQPPSGIIPKVTTPVSVNVKLP